MYKSFKGNKTHKNNDHDNWFYYAINICMLLMFKYDFGNIISSSKSNKVKFGNLIFHRLSRLAGVVYHPNIAHVDLKINT